MPKGDELLLVPVNAGNCFKIMDELQRKPWACDYRISTAKSEMRKQTDKVTAGVKDELIAQAGAATRQDGGESKAKEITDKVRSGIKALSCQGYAVEGHAAY